MSEWRKVSRAPMVENLRKANELLKQIAAELIRRDAARLKTMAEHLKQRQVASGDSRHG